MAMEVSHFAFQSFCPRAELACMLWGRWFSGHRSSCASDPDIGSLTFQWSCPTWNLQEYAPWSRDPVSKGASPVSGDSLVGLRMPGMRVDAPALVSCFTLLCFSVTDSCYCLVATSCLTLLQPHGLQPTRLLCPWDFPGKNTGVDCQFLLQGIFLTQGLNPSLLHWQADSFPLSDWHTWILLNSRDTWNGISFFPMYQ